MKTATGTYLNVHEERFGGKDVIVLFNEANTPPTSEEIAVLEKLIIQEVQNTTSSGNTQRRLVNAIEGTDLECVAFGVQVIVKTV